MNQCCYECPLLQSRKCLNCKHFVQHYYKREDGCFIPVYLGHCTTPGLKNRKPDDLACRYWEPA